MSLLRPAATVSGLTFLSRITGLVRDIIIASSFGAGALTDAFWVAFRIPNLLRRLFAEGAFSQAFVPILGQIRQDQSAQELRTVLDHIAQVLTFCLMLVTLLGVIAAPWVVSLMASGWRAASEQTTFEAAVWMTRIMFPYILCMSLIAFASGVLNTWRKFAVPAFTPVLLNLSMIAASLFLTPFFVQPIRALAVGVMLGGLAQLTVQWAALHRLGLAPRLGRAVVINIRRAWQHAVVKRIMRQMLPAILGVSVAQISLLINTNIATWLGSGSVSWLTFADRLMEFPTALLGVALATVLLPGLSAAHASNDTARYNQLLDNGLRLVLLLGLPAALGLALLSEGLVATLFNYGAFSAADVQQTRLAVCAYALGLLGLLAVKILAPGFYARQDIRTPVRIALVVLVATQIMNALFVPWLAHAGLALSVGLGATLNAALLLALLWRRGVYTPAARWRRFVLRLAPAQLALAGLLTLANQHLSWTAQHTNHWERAAQLGLLLLAALTLYFGVLWLCGLRAQDFRGEHPGRVAR